MDWLPSIIVNRIRRLLLPFLLSWSSRTYPKIHGNVKRLTKTTVIKEGSPRDLFLEYDATHYVAKNTSVPVPSVYDYWTVDENRAYLVMEYVDGEVLQRRWSRLSIPQKMTIMRTLRGFVQELRSLAQPRHNPGWIGSVSGGPFFDLRISSQSLHGPFQDERAYNDWRIDTFSRFGNEHPPTAARLQELRGDMPDDHRITFTHGDITRYNILVRVDGEGPDDVSIVALLDWEQSGWRPEFWEAAKFMFGVDSKSDWAVLGRQEIFPDYDMELARENELLLISGPPP